MEYMLGEIVLLPYGFAPDGFMLCNGDSLKIAQYPALYSLLGNKFGGDGKETFCIPDLTNAAPIANMEYYIATTGIYPTRP